MSLSILSGLGNFVLYFGLSLVFLLLFTVIYAWLTPHDEWKLVKEEQNTAAAVALSGAILGYALTVASAASNSISLIDFGVWAFIGLVTQVIAFLIVRFVFMPKIIRRIESDELPAGIILGAVSVAVGLLNAACMTY